MKIIVELETDKLKNKSLVQVIRQMIDYDDLEKLAHHDDASVRSEVAANKYTSAETLNYLSKDKNFIVKCAVASNENTSEETLYNLATEGDFLICERIAQRVGLSNRIKDVLSKKNTKED